MNEAVICVSVYQTIQTAHDTGKYVLVESRMFSIDDKLDTIMTWARSGGRDSVKWHDLVFTPIVC